MDFDELIASVMQAAGKHAPLSYNMISWFDGQLWGAYVALKGDTSMLDKYLECKKQLYALEKPKAAA